MARISLFALFLLPLMVQAGKPPLDPNWGKYLHDAYYIPTINCPQHPHALCDFYFDGFENIVPTFYLDDGMAGDHALAPIRRSTLHWVGDLTYFSPGVRDSKTGKFVLANTRNATFLKYPSGSYDADWAKRTFDQFYLNAKTDAVSHLYARSWQLEKASWGQHGRQFYQSKCVFLPFSSAWIKDTSLNLNLRDDNVAYDFQRRCVVFKTAQ